MSRGKVKQETLRTRSERSIGWRNNERLERSLVRGNYDSHATEKFENHNGELNVVNEILNIIDLMN